MKLHNTADNRMPPWPSATVELASYTASDAAWKRFCDVTYAGADALRREQSRACPCGHPDDRAACDLWRCPFLARIDGAAAASEERAA